jgi:hypothetical protein
MEFFGTKESSSFLAGNFLKDAHFNKFVHSPLHGFEIHVPFVTYLSDRDYGIQKNLID